MRLFVKLPNFHVKNVIHAMIGLKKIEHDLERSPEVRVRFETHVIDRYLDSAPLRAVQLSYLKHQIREGSLFGQP